MGHICFFLVDRWNRKLEWEMMFKSGMFWFH